MNSPQNTKKQTTKINTQIQNSMKTPPTQRSQTKMTNVEKDKGGPRMSYPCTQSRGYPKHALATVSRAKQNLQKIKQLKPHVKSACELRKNVYGKFEKGENDENKRSESVVQRNVAKKQAKENCDDIKDGMKDIKNPNKKKDWVALVTGFRPRDMDKFSKNCNLDAGKKRKEKNRSSKNTTQSNTRRQNA